jgi:outer membrane protein
MRTTKISVTVLLGIACTVSTVPAQQPSIDSKRQAQEEKPKGNIFIRPYEGANIPPIRLNNSNRLRSLIRGGKLYLTVQDAIALALENNIDIEFDRYNALIDQWQIIRAEAGGALPGVPSGSSQVSSITGGLGVFGSQSAAGVSSSGANSVTTNTVGANITQVGSVTPALDPAVQSSITLSHKSSPQAELLQSQVLNDIQNTRVYSTSISQGLTTGGNISLSYKDQYLNENAPTDLLNPATATTLSLSFRHQLLQGFGTAVNSRTITVSKANLKINDLYFKTEVIGVVANVLNLYYGLVADYADLKAKQSALDVAQRFYTDNKKQVEVGTLAPLDVTTAEAQVASSQQDLVQSQATLEQEQVSLKNVLSRTGLADPLLREAQIIPLDRIDVPEKEGLPPIKDLIAAAKANRADIEAERLNIVNDETNALNTANGTLPTLAVLAGASTQGLSGAPIPLRELPPSAANAVTDPRFIGGIGTALGQMIRRDFPSQNAGAYSLPTIYNRVSVADQVIDKLSIRQAQLQNAKDVNQIAVDVSNQVVAVQQARARYQAAGRNRILEQQLLDAEQKKFSLGASTTFLVVQQQRDLATAQANEVSALASYSNARIALDQTLGTTLEVNHVSIEEAVSGHVARPSVLPATLPTEPALFEQR